MTPSSRAGAFGPVILRRARGYAPGCGRHASGGASRFWRWAPTKNTITLVVDGQAFVSQHIGDLEHYEALARVSRRRSTTWCRCTRSTGTTCWSSTIAIRSMRRPLHALDLPARRRVAVQHHRAHSRPCSPSAVRGTSACWASASTAPAMATTARSGAAKSLPAACRGLRARRAPAPRRASRRRCRGAYPVQAAAGFLAQLDDLPDLTAAPFRLSRSAISMLGVGAPRTCAPFRPRSMGRLFDTAAALLGFTRRITFEGQAAMWLEHLARRAAIDRSLSISLRRRRTGLSAAAAQP